MRRLLVLVALAAAALAGPAGGHAAQIVIGFDDLAAGTYLTSPVGPGPSVLFGSSTSFGFPADEGCSFPQVVAAPAGFAVTPPNVAAFPNCGSAEFPEYSTMGVLSRFATQVSVKVSSATGVAPVGDNTIRLRVYNLQHTLLDSVEVPFVAAPTTLTITRAGNADIAYFSLVRPGISTAPPALDDLRITVPDVPPAAQIALQLGGDKVVRLRQGGSIQVPFRILRFNDSNGAVGMEVTGLGGELSGFFAPNPATGSAFVTPTTLTLAATQTLVLGTTLRQVVALPIGGAAVGSGMASAFFDLQVVPPFALTAAPSAKVAPCSPVRAGLSLQVEPGFTDPITLAVTSTSPSVTGSGIPATFQPGFTAGISGIDVGAPEGSGTGDGTLTITATSGPFTSTASIAVDRFPGSITSITLADAAARVEPQTVFAPEVARQGTRLRVLGEGICASSTFQFGADQPGVAPEQRDADGRSAIVRVPVTATNGVLAFVNGDGTVPGRALAVDGWRSRRGFSFLNFQSDDLAFEDMVGLFGKDETHIEVDPCDDATFGIVSCSLGSTFVPKPSALLFLNAHNDIGEGGNCFGVAIASLRFGLGLRRFDEFEGSGVGLPYLLVGPNGPSPALRRYIRLHQMAQASREGISLRQGRRGFLSANALRDTIAAILADGSPVMISIRQGDSGHAVLAYAITPTATGYAIETYDPNTPFGATEGSTPAAHQPAMANSQIVVTGNGWTFGGLNWSGNLGVVGVFDPRLLPERPLLPDRLVDVLALMAASDGPALGDPVGPDGKPLAGVEELPAEVGAGGGMTLVIPAGKAFTVDLTGPGAVSLLGGRGQFGLDGAADALTVDPRAGEVGATGARPGTALTAVVDVPGGERAVEAKLAGGGDGAVALTAAGLVRVRAAGLVALELGEATRRGVGSVRVAPFRLGKGEVAELRPASFRRAGSVRIVVRGPGGTRTLTLAVRAAAGAPKLGRVVLRVVPGGKTVVVGVKARVRLAKGSAARGTLTWRARRNGKVVATRTVDLAAPELARLAAGKELRIDTKLARPLGVQVVVAVSAAPAGAPVPSLVQRGAALRVGGA